MRNEKSWRLLSIILLKLQGDSLLKFFLPQLRGILSHPLITLTTFIRLALQGVVGGLSDRLLLGLRPSVLFLALGALRRFIIFIDGKGIHDVDVGGNEVVDGQAIHSFFIIVLLVLHLVLLRLLILFLLYL